MSSNDIKSESGNRHGGARPGSGRPRTFNKVITFKAPKEMVSYLELLPNRSDFIKQCIAEGIQHKQEGITRPYMQANPLVSLDDAKSGEIAFSDIAVAAGSPIWADNQAFPEKVDTWHMLTNGREGCAIMFVKGDSMIGDGISSGDKIIVDTTVKVVPENKIALCSVDREFTVKRVHKNNDGTYSLLPSNSDMSPIEVESDQEFVVYGQVIHVLKDL